MTVCSEYSYLGMVAVYFKTTYMLVLFHLTSNCRPRRMALVKFELSLTRFHRQSKMSESSSRTETPPVGCCVVHLPRYLM